MLRGARVRGGRIGVGVAVVVRAKVAKRVSMCCIFDSLAVAAEEEGGRVSQVE